MKFEDIVKRLTGISTPFFGVSWNPPEAERDIARRIIAFMEDRRVLYAPSEMEVPQHCVDSVIHIREFLTDEIGKLETDKEITKSLRAMRAACRKFLSRVGGDKQGEILMYGHHRNHWASWVFNDALGQMRGVFGVHIALMAVKYGLDIEGELASILPEEDKG